MPSKVIVENGQFMATLTSAIVFTALQLLCSAIAL
jgi:hypothetical protein